MLFSTKLLALPIFIWYTSVLASPLDNVYAEEGKRALKRQDGGDDIETLAQLDPIRTAVDYAGNYANQATATYTTISIGANPTDAAFKDFTTIKQGENAGSPPKTVSDVQGGTWEIDHIVELQFFVGAFSVEARPTVSPTSIPTNAWSSASSAIFTKTPKNAPFAPQQTIASAISNLKNLEGIPKRVNGFKQQVFTGRLKNQPGNPSGNTYPTDFGKALQKLLNDKKTGSFSIIGDVGDALSAAAGNNSVVKDYFTSYAEAKYTSAVDFLSTWTGISYPTAAATTKASPTPASAPGTPTAAPPAYATGTCSFHLRETQDCNSNYGQNLYGIVKMYDNAKSVIGETQTDSKHPIGYPMDDGNSYSFPSKLKDPLVITGEHANDYVQFTLGGLSWTSKSPSGGASCSVGGWDPRDGPVCGLRFGNQNAVNNMDCSFPC